MRMKCVRVEERSHATFCVCSFIGFSGTSRSASSTKTTTTTMPAPTPYNQPTTSHITPAYPALYLYPLNDSFIPKHISLVGPQRVKIGRQTNAKTVPAERNGYFDSKVLSRQHAEVWEENGKVSLRGRNLNWGFGIEGVLLSHRSSSKTSKAPTEHSSTASDSVLKPSSPTLTSSSRTILSYVLFSTAV